MFVVLLMLLCQHKMLLFIYFFAPLQNNLPRGKSYQSEGGWNDPPIQENRVSGCCSFSVVRLLFFLCQLCW